MLVSLISGYVASWLLCPFSICHAFSQHSYTVHSLPSDTLPSEIILPTAFNIMTPQYMKTYSFLKQGAVQLYVEVYDIDDGADDHVDDVYVEINLDPNTQFTTATNFYGNNGNSRISLSFRVTCTANYYGTDCATYCVPTDDASGHYTCDQGSGARICLSGWSGSDCNIRKLERAPFVLLSTPT